jgi:hypothetical protein
MPKNEGKVSAGLLMPNTTQIPNYLLDRVMRIVSPATWKIICCIARQTYGWRKLWDAISISQIETKTGLSNRCVIDILRNLRESTLLLRRQGMKAEFGWEYALNTDCNVDLFLTFLQQKARPSRKEPSGGRRSRKTGHEPSSWSHELRADAPSSLHPMNTIPKLSELGSHTKPTTSRKPTIKTKAAQRLRSESEGKAASPVSSFPLNDNTEYFFHTNQIHQWQERFPTIDVVQQLGKMRTWLTVNLARRKPRSAIEDFVIHWLANAQRALPDDVDSSRKWSCQTEPYWELPEGLDEANGKALWSELKSRIQANLTPHTFDTWFKPIQSGGTKDGMLYLKVPTPQFGHLGKKYKKQIESALPHTLTGVRFAVPTVRRVIHCEEPGNGDF